MGAIISYIQSIPRIQDICYICKKKISLNDVNAYYYKIIGLGKHDQRKICHACLKAKFIK